MSEESTAGYKLDHLPAATKQIQAIAGIAEQVGKLDGFIQILKEAVRRLKSDPHGFGDPSYRTAVGGGLVCHAVLRPIVFDYVIYESHHAVILLEVRLYADFS